MRVTNTNLIDLIGSPEGEELIRDEVERQLWSLEKELEIVEYFNLHISAGLLRAEIVKLREEFSDGLI